jgi:hypothetical protein
VNWASAWPTPAGIASRTDTALDPKWFPSLDHCASTGCVGHYEAIYNALDDLSSRLTSDSSVSGLAQTNIFTKIGSDANGNALTTQSFVQYLTTKRPRFYDGLQSTYCYDVLTGTPEFLCFKNPFLHLLFSNVKDHFTDGVEALTRAPSYPLLIFFSPSTILFPALGRNLGNEALIFMKLFTE